MRGRSRAYAQRPRAAPLRGRRGDARAVRAWAVQGGYAAGGAGVHTPGAARAPRVQGLGVNICIHVDRSEGGGGGAAARARATACCWPPGSCSGGSGESARVRRWWCTHRGPSAAGFGPDRAAQIIQ